MKLHITYVFVFEEAEHFQLPEDSFATHEALKDVRQFFQGHSSTVPRIRHRPVNRKKEKMIIDRLEIGIKMIVKVYI